MRTLGSFRFGKTLVLALAIWLWALGPAVAVECRFTRETSAPFADPETNTFMLDCALPLPAEAVWKSVRNFPRLAEKGVRPKGIEYARVLDSEAAKREVAARLENPPLARKEAASQLLNLPLDSPLLYEEYYHVNLFFIWGVRRFAADTSRSAEGIYRLTFQQVDGLSSEAVSQGGFELTDEGERSHLRYTLTLSIHGKLAGEGLHKMFQRAVVGRVYIDGYRTYMEERVAELVREAQRLGSGDGSRGG